MTKRLIVIPIHGMGDTPRNYDTKLKTALRKRFNASEWNAIDWRSVYYQDVLQKNQQRMLDAMRAGAKLDWIKLRRFLLFGFSDAAALGDEPHKPNSAYQQIQQRVQSTLEAAFNAHGRGLPILMVAHSLGAHVLSTYIWDAQQNKVDRGVFRTGLATSPGGRSAREKFLRLKTLRCLITTGCNIPIFIAGLAKSQIKPIVVDKRGWKIRWENYYDADDVLGWPLKPICPAYRKP